MPIMPMLEGEIPEEDIRAKADAGGYFEWKYKCPEDVEFSTGYEDIDFSRYDPEFLRPLPKEEQDKYVDELVEMYLERGIYPIKYFSEEGIWNELTRVFDEEVGFTGNYTKNGSAGRAYGNWRFPNLHQVLVQQQGAPRGSMYDKFFVKPWLRQAIRFIIFNGKTGGQPLPTRVYSALRLVGGSASNFKCTDARAIYERYVPEGGLILDTSMGFGGRMLGAISSPNEYTYVGTDPNTETFYHLLQQKEDLVSYFGIDPERIELHCAGSEHISGIDGEADFMFTSPPYFNLEIYSEEESQSYNEYSEIDGWIEGFVRPTIRNIRRSLKKGGRCAINIADFYTRDTGKVNFVDDWIRISNEEGLPYESEFFLGVSARAGTALQTGGGVKKERVPVFRKA